RSAHEREHSEGYSQGGQSHGRVLRFSTHTGGSERAHTAGVNGPPAPPATSAPHIAATGLPPAARSRAGRRECWPVHNCPHGRRTRTSARRTPSSNTRPSTALHRFPDLPR